MATKDKLNPVRFPNMSPKMATIVCYIMGCNLPHPAIAEMVITSDHIVMARMVGDIGLNLIIGHEDDLYRNWSNLLACAGLTTREWHYAMRRFHKSIRVVG